MNGNSDKILFYKHVLFYTDNMIDIMLILAELAIKSCFCGFCKVKALIN